MKDSNISLDFSIYDDLSAESIEALRLILESEQGRSFTFEEAKEVGVGLLKLFEALADDQNEHITAEEEVVIEQAGQDHTQLSLIY